MQSNLPQNPQALANLLTSMRAQGMGGYGNSNAAQATQGMTSLPPGWMGPNTSPPPVAAAPAPTPATPPEPTGVPGVPGAVPPNPAAVPPAAVAPAPMDPGVGLAQAPRDPWGGQPMYNRSYGPGVRHMNNRGRQF